MKTASQWIKEISFAQNNESGIFTVKQVKAIQLDAVQHGLRLAVEAKPEGVFPPMSTKDVAINNALREYVANILAIDPAKSEVEGGGG